MPKIGDDKDIMVTDLDMRIMKGDNEDEELEELDAPCLYNYKKEIKVDSNDFGHKSYENTQKNIKRLK